ncbi:MAG: hypothetical protein QGH39_09925 [Candidatus Thermoplasmatota archaeon]|jgi:hypothetical protein|nr:hypothetical protein [Candidatus Thermoplasmatota archaeon]
MKKKMATGTSSCLSFGEPGLDRFFGPLEPGTITYIESSTSFLFDVTYKIIAAALRDLRSRAVHVDGCNMLNPYRMVKTMKRFRMNSANALERVSVCRAFTAYQMSAIIDNALEERVRDAALLVVSGIQYLYQDRDMRHKEAKVMLRRASHIIGELTARFGLVTVISDIMRPHTRYLGDILTDVCHRHVGFARLGKGIRLSDLGAGVAVDHKPVPPYQTILDEFEAHWDGLSRPAL